LRTGSGTLFQADRPAMAKAQAAVRVESVTWYVRQISLREQKFIWLEWDAVNGKAPRCPTVKAYMDHDHQLVRYSISDVKPMELLVEQLTEPPIVFTSVSGDARGSIEYSLELIIESLRSTGENKITV